MEFSYLNWVKVLLGMDMKDESKDLLLNILSEAAESDFLAYTHRTGIPDSAICVIVEMIVIKYNLLGTEGLASQSYSGITETYANYPPQLINALNSFKKVKTL